MEFFNNNENENLKFKINIEGIDINNIEPRLLLIGENKNYLFFGNIENDMCIFNIPELKEYNKNENGKIKFEIISEDLYFPVWENTFDIKTKASVIVEKLEIENNKLDKKSIKLNSIIEGKKEKTDPVKIDKMNPIKIESSTKRGDKKVKLAQNEKIDDNILDDNYRIKKFGE